MVPLASAGIGSLAEVCRTAVCNSVVIEVAYYQIWQICHLFRSPADNSATGSSAPRPSFPVKECSAFAICLFPDNSDSRRCITHLVLIKKTMSLQN